MSTASEHYETLLIERRDRIALVTLNRPSKRNAITPLLQAELVTAVEACATDSDVNVVVIRGAGPSFCAGYDLAETPGPATFGGDRAANASKQQVAVSRRAIAALDMARAWSRIWNAHIPIIAQVHGHCLAGGTDLAQHCDLIVTAEDAVFGYPALRMGGTPPSNMWLYNVGSQWAKRLLFTGDTFTGRFAVEIGFALQAVAADELDASVMSLAHRIAAVGPDIVAINKFVINKGLDLMGRAEPPRTRCPDGLDRQLLTRDGTVAADRTREVGLSVAFKERDAIFGDAPIDTVTPREVR